MSASTDHVIREQLLERRWRLRQAPELGDRPELVRLLGEVDSALSRLEEGRFGVCVACGGSVETARLAANPATSLCLDCLGPEEKRDLERDLRLAAGVQAALLPDRDLEAGGWQINYHWEPAGAVSGDYCDLVRNGSDGDSIVFVFGDVSGKGVAASIQMAQLHALLRSLLALELGLEELVGRVNRLFCESTPANSFATLVAGRLEPSGRLEVVNAGHWPPLLLRAGELATVASSGLPLGLFGDAGYQVASFDLAEDDVLFLFTDGLSESRNRDGEEYGEERAGAIMAASRGLPAAAKTGCCLADLKAFRNGAPKSDDLTLMTIRRLG